MKSMITMFLSLSCLSFAFAAEAKADKKQVESEEAVDQSNFEFKPISGRDPFFSVIDVQVAKHEIQEAIRKKDEGASEQSGSTTKEDPVFTEPVEGANEAENALAKARHFAERSQNELLQGNWELAIKESEEGLEVLKNAPVSSQYAEAMKIESLRLNGFRSTAREAKLNQEAEEKFNALKLEVEGIMWSADQRSLAIISGEAFHVQDKIGDGDDAVTIVNIDPNRVDFMINHARKRFEFKRYIDN